MITFTNTQNTICKSAHLKPSWLFEVGATIATIDVENLDIIGDHAIGAEGTETAMGGDTTFYWSTKEYTYGGQLYQFKVIAFDGVKMSRSRSELGISAPTTTGFEVENNAGYPASYFEGKDCLIKLVIADDASNEEIIRQWKMYIKRCEPTPRKTLVFTCEDFLSKYREGTYPKTDLISSIYPTFNDYDSEMCVPVIFGVAYIPVRMPYIVTDTQRYLLLGIDTNTYTIHRMRAPREFGTSIWSSKDCGDTPLPTPTYHFVQSDSAEDYKICIPLIARHSLNVTGQAHTGSNNAAALTDSTKNFATSELIGNYIHNLTDGSYGIITANTATTITATLAGGTDNDWDTGDTYLIFYPDPVFLQGDKVLDPFLKYSSSATVTLTSPEEVLEYILESLGVASADIDTGGGGTFAAAASVYSGWGLTFNGGYVSPLDVEEIISSLLCQCHSTISIRDKICLRVLSKTSQKTLAQANVIKDSFSYSPSDVSQNDSGYIAYAEPDQPQDKFVKHKVTAKTTVTNPVSDCLTFDMVQDDVLVQKIGTLHHQRKLGQNGSLSFTGKNYPGVNHLLDLEPDDVITIAESRYGGTYDVLIDSMSINKNTSISMNCVRYKWALDDVGDITPSAITVEEPSYNNPWQAALVAGPEGEAVNSALGRIVIGTLILDPDYGDLSFWENKTTNFNAAVGGKYKVDTTGGAVTMTLPATPPQNGKVQWIDAANKFGTNKLTIARNGQKIMGYSEDLDCNRNYQSGMLEYTGPSYGWTLV